MPSGPISTPRSSQSFSWQIRRPPKFAAKFWPSKSAPKNSSADGQELFIYFPDGMGRSKLPPVLDRTLKMPATARNWNTVNKLLEMADGHPDSK